MENLKLTLKRTYYPAATNGAIYAPAFVCHTIELPWLNNKPKVSCIPEDTYELELFDSPKHGWVLLVKDVPGRSMIEVHPANWIRQLLGCIAPVTQLDGPGVGWDSGKAVAKLFALAFPVLKDGGKVFLTIVADKPTQN